jgi:5-methylcytosine-specific restriction endonuclease McrA
MADMSNPNPPHNKIDLPARKIANAYKKGHTIRQIADVYSVSSAPIRRILHASSIELRPSGNKKGCRSWITGKKPALERLDWDEVCGLYQNGQRIRDIIRKLKTSHYQVTYILRSRGIMFRKGGNKRGPLGKLWRSKNHRWNGGLSLKRLRYEIAEYRDWRKTILKRDGCCVLCFSKERLEAHHILPYRDCDGDKRYDVENGITVCKQCHIKLYLKEYEYIKLFKEYIKENKIKKCGSSKFIEQ